MYVCTLYVVLIRMYGFSPEEEFAECDFQCCVPYPQRPYTNDIPMVESMGYFQLLKNHKKSQKANTI